MQLMKPSMRRCLVCIASYLCWLLILCTQPAVPAVLHVPEEIPTIEEALAIAQPHDTVLVSSGLYHIYAPLSMSTTSVTLLSEEPEGAYLRGYDDLLVVSADSCVIESFSLYVDFVDYIVDVQPNVTGTIVQSNRLVGAGFGTGVYDAGTRTHVRGNRIKDCWVPLLADGSGAVIDSNVIDGNSAGLRIYGPASVLDNVIYGTVAGFDTGGSIWGGGILIWGVEGPVVIRGNQIFDNECDSFDFVGIGRGGGIHARYSDSVLIEDNWVYGNQAIHGGGIYAENSSVEISHNVMWANRDSTGMTGDPRRGTGGGLWIGNCEGVVEGNTIVANVTGIEGGGVYLEGPNSPTFVRNIISENESPGSGFFCQSGSAILECNDVWGNSENDFGGDCEDPTGTDGNISADPMFCYPDTANFRLEPGSPCAPGNSPPGCGLIGAYGVGCEPSGVPEAVPVLSMDWIRLYPNPMKHRATIAYDLHRRVGETTLTIHDAVGRRIRSWTLRNVTGTIAWDGRSDSGERLASGVYFVRLRPSGQKTKVLVIE